MRNKLALLILLFSSAVAALSGQDSFKTVLGSGNTLENYPAEAVLDGDPSTAARFKNYESFAWFQVSLPERGLVEYIDFNGTIPEGVTAWVEYNKGGYIQTFPSSFMTGVNGEFVLDLSEDHIVTDTVYIRFSGDNLYGVTVNEISVKTTSYDTWPAKKKLLISETSQSSSSYTGAQHLTDGPIGTVWRTWNNEKWGKSHWFVLEELDKKHPYKKNSSKWQSSFVELTPAAAEVYSTLKLFVDRTAAGTLTLLINGQKAGEYLLEERTGSWIVLPVKEYGVISSIRLETTSDNRVYSGIGEVELWGDENPAEREYTDLIYFDPVTEMTESVFVVDELDYNSFYQTDVIVRENARKEMRTFINNKEVLPLEKSEINGYTRYRFVLDDRDLVPGENFIRFAPGSGDKVLNAQFTSLPERETLKLTPSALSDDRLYSGGVSGDVFLPFYHGRAFVETVRVYYKESLPWNLYFLTEEGIRVYPPVKNNNGSWLEYSVHESFTGVGLESSEGATEIALYGMPEEVKNPFVKVLFPGHNQTIEIQEMGYKPVWGITDSPDSEITINGLATKRYGNYFWVENIKQNLKGEGLHTIKTELIHNGSVITDSLDFVAQSNTHEFILDQEDRVYYTKDNYFTLSGTSNPWNSSLYINDMLVDAGENMKFSYDLYLQDGLNIITIELVHKSSKTKEYHTRRVYKDVIPYSLMVTSPTDGVFVNSDSVDITGIATSRGLTSVTVNGIRASVYNGRFHAQGVALNSEENLITVTAEYENGDAVVKTLTVYKDLTPPVITDVLPENDSWFATPTVEVTGRVTEKNGFSVYVNKIKADVSGDTFSVVIPVEEVKNNVLVEARDSSGNLTQYPLFNINTDMTKPEPFNISSSHPSWTNERRPVLTFSTEDAYAGISHYEVSVDGGKFTKQESPLKTPFLNDGIIPVTVRAWDKVGNYRDSEINLYIDTLPPDTPGNFRAVSGNETALLRWSDNDDETVSYTIYAGEQTPVTVSRENISGHDEDTGNDVFEYRMDNLENGKAVDFRITATDRAGNISDSLSDSVVTGVSYETYSDEEGSFVEFENVTLVVPKDSLPEEVEKVVITEVISDQLVEASVNPIVSPILDFSVLKKDKTRAEHISFEEKFIGEISYDESALPEGFPEQNLGVYYFDSNWSRWFQVKDSGVDTVNNKVYFSTDHFTSFSVQPTVFEDLSPQELSNVEFSPFSSKVAHQPMSVSTQGGSASTSMTELSLPGKNGFDFELRRIYDSTTAKGDSSGLNINVSVTLGSILNGTAGTQLLTSAGLSVASNIENSVKKYFQNNGDYAYALGQGWRLNLPYIRGSNGGVLVRTPSGSFYDITSMNMRLAGTVQAGGYREVVFENHEGEDFVLKITQARTDISVTGIIGAALSAGGESNDDGYDSGFASLVPGWNLINAELIMKDGSSYTFDALGRFKGSSDPTGLNRVTANYNGLVLDNITDSMGRVIKFQYTDLFETSIIPQIKKIWIENDPLNREINYEYGNPGDMQSELNVIAPVKLPLLKKATDINQRTWDYDYGFEFLFAGEFGAKVNIIAGIASLATGGAFDMIADYFNLSSVTIKARASSQWVFPMDFMQGPGLGETHLDYDKKTLGYFDVSGGDYFLGLFPTAVQMDIGMEQRPLVKRLQLNMDGSHIKTENYSYSFRYAGNKMNYVHQSIKDDGVIKEINDYYVIRKTRLTVFDWSDYVIDTIASPFRDSIWREDIIPLNNRTRYFDSQTGVHLYTQEKKYNTGNLQPREITTIRNAGSHYATQTFLYDGWGNSIKTVSETVLGDIRTKSVTYNAYHNSKATGAFNTIMESLFNDLLGVDWYQNYLNETDWNSDKMVTELSLKSGLKERHNLPMASKTINYDLYNGRETVSEVYYQYDEYGNMILSEELTENGWASTQYQYGYNNGLTGEQTQIVTPVGQTIVKEYDFSHPDYYSLTETYKDVLNPEDNSVSDIKTDRGYDRVMGYLKWSTDGNGYTTVYDFDKLGRTTKIVYPDEDDDLNWNPETVTAKRGNNPFRTVVYDDVNLTVTVTERSGAVAVYQFDNLNRVTEIRKAGGTHVSSFKHDSYNNIIEYTNANNHVVYYTYSPLKEVTSRKYIENGKEYIKKIDYHYYSLGKTVTDERGISIKEFYDFNNKIIKQQFFGEYGELLSENSKYYDGNGNIVASIDALGHKREHLYNSRNLLIKSLEPEADHFQDGITLKGQTFTKYEYDLNGNPKALVKGIDNEDKTRKEFIHDGLGRRIITRQTLTDIDGVSRISENKTVYDGNNNKIKNIDPRGFIWQKGYDARNTLAYEKDPYNNTVTYTYDDSDRLASMTDARGNSGNYPDQDFTIIYEYNELDRLVRAQLPARYNGVSLDSKQEIFFEYDSLGNVLSQTMPDGGQTAYTYSSRNRLLTETASGKKLNGESLNYMFQYEYDPVGNKISKIMPDGETSTDYTYNVLNQMVKETSADGSYSEYGYDKNGNKVWATNPNGFNTLYEYDSLNRLIKITDYDWNEATVEYDLHGNISRSKDFNGNVYISRFNEAGSLIQETNSRGKIKKYYYDLAGNLVKDIDFNGAQADYTVLNNNLLSEIIYSNGDHIQSVSYTYDESGLVKTLTDNGVTTQYNIFDAVYRPDPYNQKFQVDTLGYSSVGYDYDYANRVESIKYNSGLDISQNYNNLSQLESIDGFVSEREFNNNGFLTKAVYINGVESNYGYTDDFKLGSLSYTLDGGDLKRYEYFYDKAGNIVQENENLYGYDGKNQLTTAILTGGAAEEEFVLDEYQTGQSVNDVLGQNQLEGHRFLSDKELDIDWGAKSFGIDTGYSFKIKKITLNREGTGSHRITPETIAVYTSNYNRDRAYTEVKNYSLEEVDGNIVITFARSVFARYIKIQSHYNELDREGNPVHIRASFRLKKDNPVVVEAVTGGRNEYYTLDAKGNRVVRKILSKKIKTDNYNYYENSDLLKSDTTYGYVYDDNGNLIEKGDTYSVNGDKLTITPSENYFKYIYDLKNRLIEVHTYNKETQAVERKVSYIYDGQNQRIEKINKEGISTRYVFDIFGNCIEEKTDGQSEISYVFMNNRHIARISEGRKLFYGVNNTGSTVLLTDEEGKTVWNGDITPYGDKQEGIGEIKEAVKYTGKHLDEDTGLYYFNARWYDPDLGRFVTEDPAKDGSNWYIYCQNNPLAFVDPSGLAAETIWDAFSLGMGIASFTNNVRQGNWGAAALDGLGILVDGAAVVTPFVPGGAGAAIKSLRAAHAISEATQGGMNVIEGIQEGDGVQVVVGVMQIAGGTASMKGTVSAGNNPLGLDTNVNKTVEAAGDVTEELADAAKDIVKLDASDIRFTQNSVNDSAEIIESMSKNGWKGDPIDVVQMPDGKYSSIDNTRVVAARTTNTQVDAVIHNSDDLLTPEQVERFTTKKGVPVTWGDAIELRVGKQSAGFRNGNPYGTYDMDKVKVK